MHSNYRQYHEAFMDYLRSVKRFSPHTVLSYETDLLQFYDHLEMEYEAVPLHEINAAVVRNWLFELKDELIRENTTINRKISTLKSFFKYLLRKEVIAQTPMAMIISPKNKKRLPSFVAEKDLASINTIELPATTKENYWDEYNSKMIILLLYNAGLRRSELISLTEQDVDFYNGYMKVTGKGNKQRIIPLSNTVLAQVKEYINQKPVKLSSVTNLLVLESGKPLYPQYVYERVKKYLNGSGTTITKKSPHILRHSFATHLTNNGAEITAVKELLGHSSLAATQVYTHNSIEKLKAAYKAHPLSGS
jgi:integrase/recombinase XerC